MPNNEQSYCHEIKRHYDSGDLDTICYEGISSQLGKYYVGSVLRLSFFLKSSGLSSCFLRRR